MTPSARAQAAIELLDQIIDSARSNGAAADVIVARYFKSRRYAGSKDRRAVRELVFRAIRRAGERPPSGRAALLGLAREDQDLAAAFDGSPFGPAPIGEGEPVAAAGPLPDWILALLDPLVDQAEQEALLERAPLDLRVNRLKAQRDAMLAHFASAAATPHSPVGLRLGETTFVENDPAWLKGEVEIQDEGSQLICLACEAQSGELVVDLCAGAGGKSLALGAEMGNEGRIVASDTDRPRLGRMEPRLERAGLTIVEPRLLDPMREVEALGDLADRADLVVVDAPCSGSGTWRRNPEARWRLTPERLERLTLLQARLLDVAAALVRPGGRLVYAVCSILSEEGRDQAHALAARSSLVESDLPMKAGRAAGSGRLLTPLADGTDGFFVARWQRPC